MHRGTDMHRDQPFDRLAANDGLPPSASRPASTRRPGSAPGWPPLVPMDLAGFVRLVDSQLRHSQRQRQSLAVLALRVVGIESDAGADQPADLEADLLCELGRRLRARVRASDSVAWLGGREFGVVLLKVTDAQASQVAARLNQVLGGSYSLDEAGLTVRLAMGWATRAAEASQTGAELTARATAGLGG